MRSPLIQSLIAQFSKFPTVGPRTAGRFVFHLIHSPKEEIDALIGALQNLKEQIKICSLCFYPFQGEQRQCGVCTNASRDQTKLCIVEKETDLESIEKIKTYKGLYFVLGGTVSLRRADLAEELRAKELAQRIKNANPQFTEVIVATNPTSEGEVTARYLEELIRSFNIPFSRLGRGLPIGGELEYADEETLLHALENRK
jgi:recombination protein RecR